MPWIKPKKQNDVKKQNGEPLPLFNRLIANSETMYSAFAPLQTAISHTFLSDFEKEAIITYVSMKNGCTYCTKSHGTLFSQLSGEEDAEYKLQNFASMDWPASLKCMLYYADKLTDRPASVEKEDIEQLRAFGYSEEQIVEINHVIAYTTYTNQISMGLGL
ncbi:peroxidase-related enzyme [Pontibacillus salicampi]|uniref:Peroxidase-related enzyme n=1 Tax=Pontibacillus salicampi TaxID=1449801 RepID=A0ABV6LPW5_9BACI